MNHRKPSAGRDLVSRLWPKTGPPPDKPRRGPIEVYPEAVDLAAFTVLCIFAMADWSNNAALLLVGLILRWRYRRTV